MSNRNKRMLRNTMMLIDICWAIHHADVLYSYYFTTRLWLVMFPDWLLISNIFIGLTGVVLGVCQIKAKIGLKKYLIINILLLLMGYLMYVL